MKIFRFVNDNILFLLTLFLLAFIPLYPKLPLIDVQFTWVYIRAEDFVVFLTLGIWVVLLFKKKISLRTPLTIPIMIFWIIGMFATIHGVFLIFQYLSGAHPNVALLSYLRRIEYLSLFFVAFAGMKDKRFLPYVVGVLAVTLFLISLYGFGQKFMGFPAFLTMNEEFAKGVAIHLSSESRVPSTFAGHYDLAAYLVLVIPILTSMVFACKKWFTKIALGIIISMGFALLFMTVSRISFFALLLSLFIVLFFQKKKMVTISLVALTALFLIIFPNLLQRYGNTLKETDVIVSGKTGEVIGHLTEVPASYFKNKTIKMKFAQDKGEIVSPISPNLATSAAIIVPVESLPETVHLIVETNNPTGEDLPQGSGYINLPLAPIKEKILSFYYQKSNDAESKDSENVLFIRGNYLVKKAIAYDLSFTTRFQGEWPRTIETFKKNIFIGAGYGSVSLAVDNNYLRILGEVGLLGFLSFGSIFLVAGIYIKKVLPEIDSPIAKSFILGFGAGVFGLALNAFLIDVFEASKIAFTLWLLMGICLGVVVLYQKKQINVYEQLKKIFISPYAIICYLIVSVFILYFSVTNYYFVGDDFTWFRWVSDCKSIVGNGCSSLFSTIASYFTQTNGFFYRPGTKTYFLLMYKAFWLNPTAYHTVSIVLHLLVSILVFLLSKKLLKSYFLSVLGAFLFIVLSGYSESIFWISSTGFLFNAFFALLSLLLYINWREKKKSIYFVSALISFVLSMLFHELGIVVPLFFILYEYAIEKSFHFSTVFKKRRYAVFVGLIGLYLLMRFLSHSHWFNGDYSYNLIKLPLNFVGNILGYISILLFGTSALAGYEKIRDISRNHIAITAVIMTTIVYLFVFFLRNTLNKVSEDDKKIIIFGSLFIFIALLPFLGLGNISSRYSYLSSFGFVIIFALLLGKIYSYLKSNGRDVAVASMIIVISMFTFWHLIQLQQIHEDWAEAGKQSQNLFLSLDNVYINYWDEKQLDIYFVNIPTRYGSAWVFPVGLEDAVWFVFRSNLVRVFKSLSVEEALISAKNSPNGKVFVFDSSGRLIENIKRSDGQIVSTMY